MSWTDPKLERIREFMTTDPDAGDAGAAPPLPADARVGPYHLLAKLGEGGMGVVYRARDERLGREVALKMLKSPPAAGAALAERFRREERNAARLRHPGIVTLYEVGQEGDALYYTMELVPGRPFDTRGGDLRDRVRILQKAARAVQHAHDQGIVHRDLKPANILVDGAGEPRILDFGLSMDLETPGDLTRPGHFFGTPAYMSPEQADGRVRDVGPRSDVYALGVILYETLAGQVPFAAETNLELIRRILTEEPAEPPGPPDLAAIALAALEKDAARRTATAGAFADDLGRFLGGEPVAARPVSGAGRLWRRLARHRAALGIAGAALALGAGIGLVVSQRGVEVERLPVTDVLERLGRAGEARHVGPAGGPGGTHFAEAPDPPAFLTGFRCTAFPPEAPRYIQSIQPLYGPEAARVEGALQGDRGHEPTVIAARPGYAVGGLVVRASDRVNGFRIVFQKIDGNRLDPKDRYESDWFGGKEGAETALTAPDGEAVVGLFGRAGADVDAVGMVLLRR
jgi:hypothetical protein